MARFSFPSYHVLPSRPLLIRHLLPPPIRPPQPPQTYAQQPTIPQQLTNIRVHPEEHPKTHNSLNVWWLPGIENCIKLIFRSGFRHIFPFLKIFSFSKQYFSGCLIMNLNF